MFCGREEVRRVEREWGLARHDFNEHRMGDSEDISYG